MRFLVLLLLAGCASPYATIGVAYQIDDQTDYWLQTDRDWQCGKQPQAHIEVGLEFDHQLTVGLHHQSWLMCGGPFNHRPEVYQNDIRIMKKWGGK